MQAWNILRQVEDSRSFADHSLDQTFAKNPHWRPLDRAFLLELVLGTLRWRGRIDQAIRNASKFPEKKLKPELRQLLRLGAYQILFLDKVPDSAAVNESVHLARAIFKDEKIAHFVNAILRSIAREKGHELSPSFASEPVEHIFQTLSHPRWLVEEWVKEYGPEMAREICLANNLRPPFTVRTNTMKTTRESLGAQMQALGIESRPTPFSPVGLILKKSPILAEDQLFQKGLYFVQDEASQIVAHMLDPQPGEMVLDACAAPGGKTTHLAQLMKSQGKILAADQHGVKVALLQENCRRMGASIVKIIGADSTGPFPFPAQLLFDRILVDAPCTGLGILHRNPEIRWRRKPGDAARLHLRQTALLENLSSRLKPGGVLVYSTCTTTREENDLVVEGFLEKHREFLREDLRGVVPNFWSPLIDEKGFFRTYPQMIIPFGDYRLDGFFAARMKKEK